MARWRPQHGGRQGHGGVQPGEARDYLDLAAIVASGRYRQDELLALGAQADAGFQQDISAQALAAVDRFPDEEFASYGADASHVAAARETVRNWSRKLREPRQQGTAGSPDRTAPA